MWDKRVLWKAEGWVRAWGDGVWLGMGKIRIREGWAGPQSGVRCVLREPHQALDFTILSSFGHRHGSRQETGPERGRRGKRVCRGVGTEGELACQGLTMNCLWQENGCTWQGYF